MATKTKTTTVTVTCRPRQHFGGFGAIGIYFQAGQPTVVEATDAQLDELRADPASFFLNVETGDTTKPAADPAK